MNAPAFDESSHPVGVTGFDYSALDGVEQRDLSALIAETRADALNRIRAHLEVEYQWAASARTFRARQIRFALIRGDGVQAVAKRFRVSSRDEI